MKRRICKEPGCGTRLANRNPAKVCWLHGGWVAVDFVSAVREFLASITEWERQCPKPKVPMLSTEEQKARQLMPPRVIRRDQVLRRAA